MTDRAGAHASGNRWGHPIRPAIIGPAVALAAGLLSGCGTGAPPSAAELDERAGRSGLAVELIYVMDLKGYHRATGGMGGYGADGFQDIYVTRESDVRLTVERRALTAATCPAVPIPAVVPPNGPVQCTPDHGGWRRISGDRQEYAVARGDLLIRVSGRRDATTLDLLRDAATGARRATPDELDEMLPPGPSDSGGSPGRATPVERGDVRREGGDAPDNHVGPGG